MTIKQEFTAIIPNRNFMTPRIYKYVRSGKYIIEISSGEGLGGHDIYGVTVANTETKQPEHDLSCAVDTYTEALSIARGLGDE